MTEFAFPSPADNSTETIPIWNHGITIRDYFAGLAMQGLIEAHPEWGKEQDSNKKIARISYVLAESMLAERAK